MLKSEKFQDAGDLQSIRHVLKAYHLFKDPKISL